MKVLWLCNIVLPVIARQLNLEASNKEGWLSGLAAALLENRHKNGVELSVAFPMQGGSFPEGQEIASMTCYGFSEDIVHPEKYQESLEPALKKIVDKVKPDIVHCFGTEYPHTLAMCRVFQNRERLLVGLQGLCAPIAEAYFANLPEQVVSSVTFRDWLKDDSLRRQQEKFVLRGRQEREILGLAGNISGRTQWDRENTEMWNPHARYYPMNETLRGEFYGPVWREADCIPHSIFLSQGDYPLKGLHYMLLAMPAILARYPDAKVFVAGSSLVGYRTLKEKVKLSAYGKYLRQLLKQGGLEGKVFFTGRMNAEEMRDRYLKSSLYVCCSSLENSPNSLGEAMLLGMPCVCAAVGGIPSMFRDGEDGIAYEGFSLQERIARLSGDSSGGFREAVGKGGGSGRFDENTAELERVSGNLATAVLEMWDNPEKQRRCCKNAKAHAENTHNREKNYARLIEIYTEMMERSGNGAMGARAGGGQGGLRGSREPGRKGREA